MSQAWFTWWCVSAAVFGGYWLVLAVVLMERNRR